MKKSLKKKYAKVVARVGANVQKGQEVVIRASVDQVEFATYVQEECYRAGAKSVVIEWITPASVLINKVKYEDVEVLGNIKKWQIEKLSDRAENLPALIHIESDSPDELKDLDQAKSARARMLAYPIQKPLIDKMDGKYQWTIVGVPSVGWAKMVFPNESPKKAVEKLWEAILHTARITDDPVEAWRIHNANLLARCDYLNSFDFDYLKYESSNGTNFKVWMTHDIKWLGGGETTPSGVYYNPNMPTEECFTTPIKGKAEGMVYASKPLSYNGDLIEDFYFEFKDGKVVNFGAKKGYELLEQMLNMDENASYLGECALVPFESPINETGILFYNTLYDENAVCHFALGRGFIECLREPENKTKEDYDRIGINDSMIHVDFMIGTRDMNITGYTKDGKEVKIFVNGTWAF